MQVVLKASSPEAREKAIYAITHFEEVKIVTDGAGRKSLFKTDANVIRKFSSKILPFAIFFTVAHSTGCPTARWAKRCLRTAA